MNLSSSHPKVVEGRTIHPKTLRTPDPHGEQMTLKPSTANSKLGGFVKSLKKRLKQVVENLQEEGKTHRYGRFPTKTSNNITKAPKGAKDWIGLPMYSLTLEERATCPDYCFHWKTCYGNNMGFANRYDHSDPDLLERTIERDLMYLASVHPNGFVIRLHVLGEFYSIGYVSCWATWLEKYPMLKVFGYSARLRQDAIGNELRLLREQYPKRFKIWWSNGGHEKYSANSLQSEVGLQQYKNREAIICPHEIRHNDGLPLAKNCLSCGICFALDELNMHILFTEKHINLNELKDLRR